MWVRAACAAPPPSYGAQNGSSRRRRGRLACSADEPADATSSWRTAASAMPHTVMTRRPRQQGREQVEVFFPPRPDNTCADPVSRLGLARVRRRSKIQDDTAQCCVQEREHGGLLAPGGAVDKRRRRQKEEHQERRRECGGKLCCIVLRPPSSLFHCVYVCAWVCADGLRRRVEVRWFRPPAAAPTLRQADVCMSVHVTPGCFQVLVTVVPAHSRLLWHLPESSSHYPGTCRCSHYLLWVFQAHHGLPWAYVVAPRPL